MKAFGVFLRLLQSITTQMKKVLAKVKTYDKIQSQQQRRNKLQIRLKLKPIIQRFNNRDEALRSVTANLFTVNSSVFGKALQRSYKSFGNTTEYVRVYSIQKIRAKSVEIPTTHGGFSGKIKEKKKIRNTQVEVVYYDIPIVMLNLMGKKVEQGNKTWEFV